VKPLTTVICVHDNKSVNLVYYCRGTDILHKWVTHTTMQAVEFVAEEFEPYLFDELGTEADIERDEIPHILAMLINSFSMLDDIEREMEEDDNCEECLNILAIEASEFEKMRCM
jgi:hypothetical protein